MDVYSEAMVSISHRFCGGHEPTRAGFLIFNFRRYDRTRYTRFYLFSRLPEVVNQVVNWRPFGTFRIDAKDPQRKLSIPLPTGISYAQRSLVARQQNAHAWDRSPCFGVFNDVSVLLALYALPKCSSLLVYWVSLRPCCRRPARGNHGQGTFWKVWYGTPRSFCSGQVLNRSRSSIGWRRRFWVLAVGQTRTLELKFG